MVGEGGGCGAGIAQFSLSEFEVVCMSTALDALLELSLKTAFLAVSHDGIGGAFGGVGGGGLLLSFCRLSLRSWSNFCARVRRGVGVGCGVGGAEIVVVGVGAKECGGRAGESRGGVGGIVDVVVVKVEVEVSLGVVGVSGVGGVASGGGCVAGVFGAVIVFDGILVVVGVAGFFAKKLCRCSSSFALAVSLS